MREAKHGSEAYADLPVCEECLVPAHECECREESENDVECGHCGHGYNHLIGDYCPNCGHLNTPENDDDSIECSECGCVVVNNWCSNCQEVRQ